MKTLADRLKNDILSDNTHANLCEQCKTCKHWNGGDMFSNRYTKSNCAIYMNPDMKPRDVINNLGPCPRREEAGNG